MDEDLGMLLLFVVFGGTATFCFIKGYVVTGIICLFSFQKHGIGLVAFVTTSISLFILGHWILGLIMYVPIAWNILGMWFFLCRDIPFKDYMKSMLEGPNYF